MVRLSALCTGFLYTPGDIPGTISIRRWVDPRATAWPDCVNEKYQWHYWELNQQPFSLQQSASTNYTRAYPCIKCVYDILQKASSERSLSHISSVHFGSYWTTYVKKIPQNRSLYFLLHLWHVYASNLPFIHTQVSFPSTAQNFYVPTCFNYHCSHHHGATLLPRQKQCIVHQYGKYKHIREKRTAHFWAITQWVVVISYQCFRMKPEDETDSLSRNVRKKSPLLAV